MKAPELLTLVHDRGVNCFDNAGTCNNGVAEQVMGDVLAGRRFTGDRCQAPPRKSRAIEPLAVFVEAGNHLPQAVDAG